MPDVFLNRDRLTAGEQYLELADGVIFILLVIAF
jgi:hypothetical protein